VQGTLAYWTLAYCLPRQISFSVPISSVRGGIGRRLSLVSSFGGKIATAHFCAVPVAVANSAACSPLLVRMQQIGRMPEHPRRSRCESGCPRSTLGVMHHGFAPRGHNYALILQAVGLARSPSLMSWSCNTKHGYMMRSDFVLHGSGMMHDSSDGVSNNVLLRRAPRFRHAVAQT
jgi:hypothetical protein